MTIGPLKNRFRSMTKEQLINDYIELFNSIGSCGECKYWEDEYKECTEGHESTGSKFYCSDFKSK